MTQIRVSEYKQPCRHYITAALIIVLAFATTASILLAYRNSKPVCERISDNVCQFDLGEHYTNSDYIKASAN